MIMAPTVAASNTAKILAVAIIITVVIITVGVVEEITEATAVEEITETVVAEIIEITITVILRKDIKIVRVEKMEKVEIKFQPFLFLSCNQ